MRSWLFAACLALSSCSHTPPPVCQEDEDWGCDCSEQDDIDLAKYVARKGCVWVVDQYGEISQICPAVVIPTPKGEPL
jgi:hypothetical protein